MMGGRAVLAGAAAAGAGVLLPQGAASALGNGSPVGSADQRAAALVAQMTLDEKIAMVHGAPSATYIGYVPGLPRLNIPALFLTDGPAGIRTPKKTSGPSTAFPAPIAVAASFDAELAGRVGRALGSEAKAKGQNVVFAPIVNLARVPEGGRLFEGFGEDPQLTSVMGVAVIKGIQSTGVVANVKHWIYNDQEDNRHVVSATVDERTLREVYLPPFAAAVSEAGVGSVMAANNAVNGMYNAQSGRNVGARDGEEVVQLYLGQPSNGRQRHRRSFGVSSGSGCGAGSGIPSSSPLNSEDLARWDVKRHRWHVQAGRYHVGIGASSRDIRVRRSIEVR